MSIQIDSKIKSCADIVKYYCTDISVILYRRINLYNDRIRCYCVLDKLYTKTHNKIPENELK